MRKFTTSALGSSPLIPRPLLREGEGEASALLKTSQHLAHPARRREGADSGDIEGWIELAEIDASHFRMRADQPRRIEEILNRNAARPGPRRAGHGRALDNIDVEIDMDHIALGRQTRQRILGDRR